MKIRNSQQGVALVITLIMLSVITVITVAFLAVTTRETGSVANASHHQTAMDMTAAALERARAEILVEIRANTNRLGPNLMVSTNIDGGFPYLPNDELTISSLWVDPRAPVFVVTNDSTPPESDFRFWIDLDRNGRFTPTGDVPLVDEFGNLLLVTNFVVGDPQWIGVLRDPMMPHGRDNRFVGRYAYIVVPAGQALDLNYIHNNAKGLAAFREDRAGFLRNQGVGSWELNLAAFLADLNTNQWDYYYAPLQPLSPSGGRAFDDATELLSHRYNNWFENLFRASDLIFPVGTPLTLLDLFTSDLIDVYANGPIPPLTAGLQTLDDLNDLPSRPWPGSDSVRHFFSLNDFFDDSPAGYSNFVSHLRAATFGRSTYDETTFYRMLSQLATDSAPEEVDPFTSAEDPLTGAILRRKVNLNYNNFDYGPTNLVEWEPVDFFRTVADQMLREETGGEVTIQTIPVYTNLSSVDLLNGVPLYSPRIHQLLQIAANLTDARRADKAGEVYPYYPSVFRPQYEMKGSDLYITNYVEMEFDAGGQFSAVGANWYDVDFAPLVPGNVTDANFYGIPPVVGAMKGFPAFNEFTAMTSVQVGRKLEFRKNLIGDIRPNQTNQMFTIGISNIMALEAWNSYRTMYPRELGMVMVHEMTTVLTNNSGMLPLVGTQMTRYVTNFPAGTWMGKEFKLTPAMGMVSLPESVYYVTPSPHFEPVGPANRFEPNPDVYLSQWGLLVTNRLLCFLYDNQRLIDAVAFADMSTYFDISRSLAGESTGLQSYDDLWDPTPVANVNNGVMNQIQVSMGNLGDFGEDGMVWNSYGSENSSVGGDDRRLAIDKFRRFMDRNLSPLYYDNEEDRSRLESQSIVAQAPFTPVKKIYQMTTWQANDPLVQDLVDHVRDDVSNFQEGVFPTPDADVDLFDSSNLGEINTSRYKPWGAEEAYGSSSATDRSSMAKDPGIRSSDDWNFPTNKFPSIGWMGRVHRGTPWQTIYLKAGDVDRGAWAEHVGSAGRGGMGNLTAPINDRRLVDLFTTAIHPNATRGTLSVNQNGRAAWSAVLAGVPVTTVVDNGTFLEVVNAFIEPAANSAELAIIVDAINAERNSRPRNRFPNVGSLLTVPELTDASPFLVLGQDREMLRDEDYERIPQQILSLLKVGDARFVVYAFGQSLMPAERSYLPGGSILPSGPNFGLTMNYQVTGESASRAVVRVDFERDLDGDPMLNRSRAAIETFNLAEIE